MLDESIADVNPQRVDIQIYPTLDRFGAKKQLYINNLTLLSVSTNCPHPLPQSLGEIQSAGKFDYSRSDPSTYGLAEAFSVALFCTSRTPLISLASLSILAN